MMLVRWPRLGNRWCILLTNQRQAIVTEPHRRIKGTMVKQ